MGLFNISCTFVLVASLSIISIDAFSQGELDALSSLANDFIKKNIIGRNVTDINHKNGYLREITITDITLPKISIKESQDKLTLSLSGAGLSAQANYMVKFWFIRESGSLTASASVVSLSLPISLRPSSFLSVDESQCRDSIGGITYNARGGLIGTLANILRGFVQNLLKGTLNGEICEAVTKAITENAHGLSCLLGQ